MGEIGVPSKCYEELEDLLGSIQEEIMALPVSETDQVMQSRLFKILEHIQTIKMNLVGMYD